MGDWNGKTSPLGGNGEALAVMSGTLDLVDDRNGEILSRDRGAAIGVHQQDVAADAELTGPVRGSVLAVGGAGADVEPVDIRIGRPQRIKHCLLRRALRLGCGREIRGLDQQRSTRRGLQAASAAHDP